MNPGRFLFSIYVLVSILLVCFGLSGPAASDTESDERKKDRIDRMYADYKKEFPKVKDIAAEKAMQLWRQGRAVFVDTRKPEEMAVSMLPGAITKEAFLENPQQYRDKTAIGYCTISYRSGLLARDMAQKGIQIVNLQGGILAWIHAGGPVLDSHGKVAERVHVYGKRWNLAPQRYETVMFGLWGMIF